MNNFFLKIAILFLLNFSCNKSNIDNKFEQKVFEDIFPELIEKTFMDMRKMPPAIPPPPNMPSDKEIDEILKKNEDYLESTKFKPLYVIVSDSLDAINKKELKALCKEKGITFIDITKEKHTIKLDLSKIDLGEDFILKYKSQINKPIKELRLNEFDKEPHLRSYSGTISFSRIYFNSTKTLGFFKAGFTCGKLCGFSFEVYIQKENNKWSIHKVECVGMS